MIARTLPETDPHFFSFSAAPLALLAADGKIARLNDAWSNVLADGADAVGRPFVALVRAKDRPRVEAALAALTPDAPATFEVLLSAATPDLAARSVRFHATRAEGGAVYLVGVVSPEGRVDDALRLALFDEVIESAPVGILAVAADGTILANEGRLSQMAGYAGEELNGQNALEKWKDTPFPSQLRRALAGERYHERISGDLPSGVMHIQQWFFPLVDGEGAGGAVLFSLDVTAEVSLQMELREKLAIIEQQGATQRMFASVLQSAPLVLWAVDEKGDYTLSEGKGLDLIGFQPGEAVGLNALEMFKDHPEIAQAIVGSLAGVEARLITTPAPGVHFENWYMPLRGDDGAVRGVMGLAMDCSARLKNEQELRDKLELIERQSATIRALATPIIQVWDEVLCLPVIGTVDSARTADMMQGLLEAIVREQARYAIVDLTGVEIVDTATADHLIQLFRAAKVLGVDGILCGIRPAVAQTVVALGLELGSVRTMRSLRDALKWCIRLRSEPRSDVARHRPLTPSQGR
jgi:rsbT co-antagonist protein RsbR